jgi:hypothetical protein
MVNTGIFECASFSSIPNIKIAARSTVEFYRSKGFTVKYSQAALLKYEIELLTNLMQLISDEWNVLPVKGRTQRYNAYMMLFGIRCKAKQKLSELKFLKHVTGENRL